MNPLRLGRLRMPAVGATISVGTSLRAVPRLFTLPASLQDRRLSMQLENDKKTVRFP
jgi:hypothetical protein